MLDTFIHFAAVCIAIYTVIRLRSLSRHLAAAHRHLRYRLLFHVRPVDGIGHASTVGRGPCRAHALDIGSSWQRSDEVLLGVKLVRPVLGPLSVAPR